MTLKETFLKRRNLGNRGLHVAGIDVVAEMGVGEMLLPTFAAKWHHVLKPHIHTKCGFGNLTSVVMLSVVVLLSHFRAIGFFRE